MSLDGVAALREINRFIEERRLQKEPLSESESRALDTVRRDAIHAILQQQDASMFKEFDRLKLVELEYLYQVRGVRQVMPSAIFGEGYAGYGNGWTGSRIRLLYLQDRKRAGRMSREAFLPINKIRETADLNEQLVPLRINLTTDKHRLRDRLLWNADDTTIPLELFVENMLEDYGLPLTLAPQVSQMLQEQISGHLPHIYPTPPQTHGPGTESETSATNEAQASAPAESPAGARAEPGTEAPGDDPRKTPAEALVESSREAAEAPVDAEMEAPGEATTETLADTATSAPADAATGRPAEESAGAEPVMKTEQAEPDVQAETGESAKDQAPESNKPEEKKNYDEDMRITIKLDITVGHHQLVDQFEWDINNPENDPEMFGVILANELSLPQEFGPAVAHAIREQSQAFTRALFHRGYQFDGTLPSDQQLQSALSLPVDEHAFLRRPEMLPLFSPALNDANITGLNPDHHEQEQERRELRSRRRQGRSSRRGHHDGRGGGISANKGDITFTTQDSTGPDFCTPLYSSVLPGGLDRNLDILHMTAYHLDEVYGGERQDILYYFHKLRRERQIPSASQFESGLITEHKPQWLVKLKLPKRAATAGQ